MSLSASLLLAFWHLSAHERYCECGARARMFYYLGGWGLAGGLGVAVVVYIRGKVNSSCCSKSLGKPRPPRARSGLSECEPVWRYFRPKARTARIASLTLSDRSGSNLGHDFMILGWVRKQTPQNTEFIRAFLSVLRRVSMYAMKTQITKSKHILRLAEI